MISAARLVLAALLLAGAARAQAEKGFCGIDWVEVPGGSFILGSREAAAAHPPRKLKLAAFSISAKEIGVDQFCRYLNDSGQSLPAEHPQIEGVGRQFKPGAGKSGEALAFVSYHDAEDFCRWLDARSRATIRLPSPQEWETAARGGIAGGRYPWGWCDPAGRANFASNGAERPGSYPANGYGLFDMAGNLFEWCRSDDQGSAPARGGSWSEEDPKLLRVFAETTLPKNYRGADIGFRVVAINPGNIDEGESHEAASGHRQRTQD